MVKIKIKTAQELFRNNFCGAKSRTVSLCNMLPDKLSGTGVTTLLLTLKTTCSRHTVHDSLGHKKQNAPIVLS